MVDDLVTFSPIVEAGDQSLFSPKRPWRIPHPHSSGAVEVPLEVLEVTVFGCLHEGPEPHSVPVAVVGLGQPFSVRSNPLFLTHFFVPPVSG